MSFVRFLLDALSRPFQALFSLPLALFVTPRRLLGMSLPARSAILLALLMWLIIPAGFLAYWLTPDRADPDEWLKAVPILALCATLAPLLVYWGMRWWLESRVSRFPHIDSAWRAGLSALQGAGLDFVDLPVFLVIGPADLRQTRALFRSSGLDFRVRGVPEDGGELQWYANSDAVFLVLNGVGSAAYLRESLEALRDDDAPQGDAAPRGDDDEWPESGGMMTAVVGGRDVPPPRARDAGTPRKRARDEEDDDLFPGGRAVTAEIGGTPDVGRAIVRPDEKRLREGADEVKHVLRLLSRSRQPVVPINGVLAIVPVESLRRGVSLARLMKEGLAADVKAIREEGQARCPLTVVVGGLEAEPGFLELARRRGFEKARYKERIGRGARSLEDLWAPPTEERLVSIVAHACASFEDLVYDSFRKNDGYNKPGNFKLYSLLCAIRHEVSEHLGIVVRGVAGLTDEAHEPGKAKHDGMLFNGCYFAATGSDEPEQLYLAGVFQKLLDWCDEVQWTEQAMKADERCHQWARWSLLVAGLLLIVVAAILLDWYL